MKSQQGEYDAWYALVKLALGPGPPLTFQGGGTPDAIRRLTPQEIRRFHRQHYVLGPSTPLVIVMDRQQPPEQVLAALERLLLAFHYTESNAARETVVASHPRILPAERRELRLVPRPSKDGTDPRPLVV